MNADSHDHSQQNRDKRQPHFFTLGPSLCQAADGFGEPRENCALRLGSNLNPYWR